MRSDSPIKHLISGGLRSGSLGSVPNHHDTMPRTSCRRLSNRTFRFISESFRPLRQIG
jgi:hypothetical protein